MPASSENIPAGSPSRPPPPWSEAGIPFTELPNPLSRGIDAKRALEIVEIIHRDGLRAWEAVGSALDRIADVVEQVVESLRAGGRLIYVGAGSSGRLGVLDAAECPPTFGVDADVVRGIIAGGDQALRSAVEGAEDSRPEGAGAIRKAGVRAQDVVCGIAASGTTPYVWGALEEAALRDATTVLLTSNPGWAQGGEPELVDYTILLQVGPEIIAGSSRMKAGTATKLVLNMLSTAAMIRWGKVYDNLMVDLVPANTKLRLRAAHLVEKVGGVPGARAAELLEEARGDVKTAIVCARKGVDPHVARDLLRKSDGGLRGALEEGES
jgi:N-acetylmuramic acid 6-phosphate etherase